MSMHLLRVKSLSLGCLHHCVLAELATSIIRVNNKQLLPGLLVDSADYHPEKELFPSGVALGK